MKSLYTYIAIILLFLPNNASAQVDTTSDYFEIDSLDWDDLDFEDDFELNFDYSTGYFPRVIPNKVNVYLNGEFFYLFENADNYSPGQINGLYEFSDNIPFFKGDPEFYKKWNKYEKDGNGIDAGGWRVMIEAEMTSFLPFFFRVKGGIGGYDGVLVSGSRSRPFMTREKTIDYFNEQIYLYNEEYFLTTSASIDIPIYGGFIEIDENYLFSYYFLSLGFDYERSLYSKATIFSKIENNTNRIRYSNGRDTLNLLYEKELNGLNYNRTYFKIGLGMNTITNSFGFKFSLNYYYPLGEVVAGSGWKQHKISINISLALTSFF